MGRDIKLEKTSKYIIICDVDNCYTDSRDWLKHAPQVSTKDKSVARSAWDKYQTFSFLAKPNKSVIDFVLATSDLIPVYFVTSREDRKQSREDTVHQIEKFSNGKIKIGDVHKLCMRREFDYRPSDEVKKDITLDLLSEGCIPIVAIDDDENNCKMFAELGIPVKQYDIETDTFSKYYEPENKDYK